MVQFSPRAGYRICALCRVAEAWKGIRKGFLVREASREASLARGCKLPGKVQRTVRMATALVAVAVVPLIDVVVVAPVTRL